MLGVRKAHPGNGFVLGKRVFGTGAKWVCFGKMAFWGRCRAVRPGSPRPEHGRRGADMGCPAHPDIAVTSSPARCYNAALFCSASRLPPVCLDLPFIRFGSPRLARFACPHAEPIIRSNPSRRPPAPVRPPQFRRFPSPRPREMLDIPAALCENPSSSSLRYAVSWVSL